MKRSSACEAMVLAIWVMSWFSFSANAQSSNHEYREKISAQQKDPSHYEFQLNFNEYSVLNGALVSGLTKHGGSLDYEVKVAIEDNEIAWIFTMRDKDAMENLHYFLMEKSEEWRQAVRDDSTNLNKISALNILQGLAEKVSEAHANPVLDLDIVVGVAEKKGDGWIFKDSLGSYPIIGIASGQLQNALGKTIVGYGLKKASGEFEMVRFTERKQNTLELFVMSQCPVAQQVENGLFKYLEDHPVAQSSALEFHYIFYSPEHSGKKVFSSLHGEEEMKEDLVQIVIRDHHPEIFTSYLKKRIQNKTAPWEMLLQELRLSGEAIRDIASTIVIEREALIEKEYNYVMGVHRVDDGSPTFIWEGRKVRDISTIPAFKGISFPLPANAGCSN